MPSRALLAVILVVASLASIPVVTAARTDDDKTVRICHATSSQTNPYVSQSPAIANNGDLQGGHLNHTGPVFPAAGWGDIIPPYTYVDQDGVTQTFPGSNWSPEGQAIWENGCEPPQPPQPPEPDPITPSLDCVEPSGSGLLAHFTYDNPNSGAVTPDVNRFSPPPESRGQPATFEPGSHDVPGIPFDGDVTWELTTKQASASSSSRRCQGSLTVIKNLDPDDDPGRFDLKIEGEVAAERSSASSARAGRRSPAS